MAGKSLPGTVPHSPHLEVGVEVGQGALLRGEQVQQAVVHAGLAQGGDQLVHALCGQKVLEEHGGPLQDGALGHHAVVDQGQQHAVGLHAQLARQAARSGCGHARYQAGGGQLCWGGARGCRQWRPGERLERGCVAGGNCGPAGMCFVQHGLAAGDAACWTAGSLSIDLTGRGCCIGRSEGRASAAELWSCAEVNDCTSQTSDAPIASLVRP